MPGVKLYEELNEKVLDIILNFKDDARFDRRAVNEILKLRTDIKKIIPYLSKEEQKILELRYVQNLSIDNIASKIGQSKEEVSKISLKAASKIKEYLSGGLESLNEIKPSLDKNANYKPILALIIGLMVFVFVFIIVYFLAPKIFSSQFLNIKHFMVRVNNFVDEQVLSKVESRKVKKILLSDDPSTVRISGSTSLLTLSRKWESAFSIEYPRYKAKLISSDSDEGINDLIGGKIDLANSSRPITYPDEQKAAKNGIELIEHRVALDALVIIVNNKNPIEELSLDNLENIFSGEIMSWQVLGGLDKPVIAVGREEGSGTNEFVINRILEGNEFPSSVTRKNSKDEIIKLVSENEGAISFINSTNYPWENQNIKYLKIKTYDNSVSFSPFEGKSLNEQAIRYGDYPLAHYLYLITTSEAPKKVSDFIRWVLSAKGQEIVRDSSLIPIESSD